MAAWTCLAPSFSLRSRVYGVGTAAFPSSSSLDRLHQLRLGGMVRITPRHQSSSSLDRLHQLRLCGMVRITPRHGGASLVSPPRCQRLDAAAALDAITVTECQRLDAAAALDAITVTDSLIKSIWPLMVESDFLRYTTRERFSIIAISVCGACIPLETGEKLAIAFSEWSGANRQLCQLDHVQEACVLSTPSRLEIYVLALREYQDGVVSQVTDWISKSRGVPVPEICKYRAVFCDKDAVEHLFQVSSSVDSVVFGERNVLARVCQAERVLVREEGPREVICSLFSSAVSASERVKRDLCGGGGPAVVCESSAAVELATRSIAMVAAARVLVVEAEAEGMLVIQHLVVRGFKKITVVTDSRTAQSRLAELAAELGGGAEITCNPYSQLYKCAAESDLVFTTTPSYVLPLPPPFLSHHVEKLPPPPNQLKQEQEQKETGKRLFIDLSVPRSVGHCVASLGTARVYTLDDLKPILEEAASDSANKEYRLMKAEPVIQEKVMGFESRLEFLTIESLRAMIEERRRAWLDKRLAELGDDDHITQPQSVQQTEDDSWVWVNNLLANMLDDLSKGT